MKENVEYTNNIVYTFSTKKIRSNQNEILIPFEEWWDTLYIFGFYLWKLCSARHSSAFGYRLYSLAESHEYFISNVLVTLVKKWITCYSKENGHVTIIFHTRVHRTRSILSRDQLTNCRRCLQLESPAKKSYPVFEISANSDMLSVRIEFP